MKGSRPLTNDETRKLKSLFSGRWGKRNQALFFLGANTGFRITELLSITLGDLVDLGGNVKESVTVSRRYMKRKSEGRTVPLNRAARNSISPWLRQLASLGYTSKHDLVFQTQHQGNKSISATQAWRVLTQAYQAGGFSGTLGTHAMRKTFANNVYQHLLRRQINGEQIDAFRMTSKALGHKDINSTDKYLSFNYEDIYLAIHAVEV